LDTDYAPETVNTDGWTATQNAWKALFHQITIILCFLHEVSSTPSMTWIKIRDRAKKDFGELGQELQKRVWGLIMPPANEPFLSV
jgi:hypothetical protein